MRADRQWADRALPGEIERVIRECEGLLENAPERIEVRWRLLRALHFAGEFGSKDDAEAHRAFQRGRAASEEGLDLLAARGGARLDALEPVQLQRRIEEAGLPRRDVARLHFWAAIHWGAWSRSAGLLETVRQGVAQRLNDYVHVTLALEPGYDGGAAYRLLGSLHAQLPKVPFVSGWVDRDQALPLLVRALEIAPDHPGNRLLLALVMLDLAPDRVAEARSLLEEVASSKPRASAQIEDLAIRDQARERLHQLRAEEAA